MTATIPQTQEPFQGVTYQIENDKDVVRWKNEKLPRNTRLYFSQTVGLLFFIPLATFLSYRLIRELVLFNFTPLDRTGFYISVLIAIGCWIGAAATAFSFVRLKWTEAIIVGDETITLTCEGPFAYKPKQIVIGDIWRLSYEKYRHNQDQEFRYSVNIIHKDRTKLAYWMRKQEAYQLYQLLGGILQRRGVAGLIQMMERIEDV